MLEHKLKLIEKRQEMMDNRFKYQQQCSLRIEKDLRIVSCIPIDITLFGKWGFNMTKEVGNNDRADDGEVVMEKESRGSVGQSRNVQ